MECATAPVVERATRELCNTWFTVRIPKITQRGCCSLCYALTLCCTALAVIGSLGGSALTCKHSCSRTPLSDISYMAWRIQKALCRLRGTGHRCRQPPFTNVCQLMICTSDRMPLQTWCSVLCHTRRLLRETQSFSRLRTLLLPGV